MDAGSTLGSYEIRGPLGSGGMGEVYRAYDRRLKRDLAVKLLPSDVTQDPDHRARLQREAQLLATLNHPNLAGVYGFEEADGVAFLAMELVEGRGLDEMIAAGPIPFADALELAIAIAQGLEAAHEKGIVHRDLKPANIRVTPEGVAKVLDFGLAKADPDSGVGGSSPQLTASPTMASPTAAGVILGTAAYMSPEQARGRPLDRRTDIWAFGCVLYEMLTSQRAFSGDTVTDVLAAIIKEEPDWGRLPPGVDRRARDLLLRCLRKDPLGRLRDVGDARVRLQEIMAGAHEAPGSTSAGETARTPMLPWSVAAVLGLLLAVSLVWPRATPDDQITWLSAPLPAGQESDPYSQGLAVSPLGTAIAYAATVDGVSRIFLRELDSGAPRELADTRGAGQLTYSHDGRAIAFSDGARIRAAPVDGSAPRDLCAACTAVFGLAWMPSGDVVFAVDWGGPLTRLSPTGEVTPFTELDRERRDIAHLWPQGLPGGDQVLFTIWQAERRLAAVASLQDGSVRILGEGGEFNRYSTSGHLLYVVDGTLTARAVDVAGLTFTGTPFAVADGVYFWGDNALAGVALSATGVLAYRRGREGVPVELLWADREGNLERALEGSATWTGPVLSPDDRRVAVGWSAGNGYQVIVMNLEDGTRTTVTAGGDNLHPVFLPDGSGVIYVSSIPGPGYSLVTARFDGTEPPPAVYTEVYSYPIGLLDDGETLVYAQLNPGTGWDILSVRDGDAEPIPVVASPGSDSFATISPDGGWLAYCSNESGSRQIYITDIGAGRPPLQITTDGGCEPTWSPAGDEIFYRRGESLIAREIDAEDDLSFGEEQILFNMPRVRLGDSTADYDVAARGERFLFLRRVDVGPGARQVEIIRNLPALLRRLDPASRDGRRP